MIEIYAIAYYETKSSIYAEELINARSLYTSKDTYRLKKNIVFK